MNANRLTQRRGVVAALGPGIIYAGAAIGVSHLVQSTRAGATSILVFLTSHMRHLLDFVTTVAFLSAPLFAYLNYRAIFAAPLPDEAVPPTWLRVLSWSGLALLVGFSLLFLWVRFGIER